MKTIWKYPVDVIEFLLRKEGTQRVMMPTGAEILSAQMQGGQLCLWVLAEPSSGEQAAREIHIVGTGRPISDIPRRFIATVQAGPIVWHVFELL